MLKGVIYGIQMTSKLRYTGWTKDHASDLAKNVARQGINNVQQCQAKNMANELYIYT